jgi:hypothetical protein
MSLLIKGRVNWREALDRGSVAGDNPANMSKAGYHLC